jgi:predicted ribosome quality control (RQC) complex YloA/Tae2 family protein
MNHLNCFVLEAIAKSLNTRINGSQLIDCYSNSVDDICFEFEQTSIRCLFYEGAIFFYVDAEAPGKNRLFKPQFPEIKGLKALQVIVHPFERSFHIEFENDFKLVFKCHGRKSNIILFEGEENIDVFKKHLEKDADMHMEDIFRTVQPVFDPQNFTDQKTFALSYPYLPEEFFEMLPDPGEQAFNQLIAQYRNIKGISFDNNFNIHPLFGENSILSDIGHYSSAFLKYIVFKTQKEKLLAQYQQAIHEKQNFISSNKKALEDLLSKRSDEEIGHIILSNLHLIQEGAKQATLNDIYHNQPIVVKLDDKLSAVENAEKYYKKAKNRPVMLKLLQQKINKAEQDLASNKKKLHELEQAEQFKSIKHLVNERQKKQEETDLPYKKFTFEGYDILVGKHAESNEKILNYFSDKNDTWLHAKDVSGSHVLIKMKVRDKLPENVLEKAASLAAYYSKNRNQALVTVMYTPRKYVRKIKGADKGKVTVSQEKTILVKPGK